MAAADARSAIALCALAAALAAGVWELPGAARRVNREVQDLRSASALERELGGARRVDVDTRVLVAARDVIPPDARFAVVTGPNVQLGNPVTLHAVAPFAGYWLLPRRRVVDPGEADWIVSYGGDLEALGVELGRVVEVGEGIALAEVRR
jgi:hypothetical protein